MRAIFPEDPPRFMARIPHGYHELASLARDLRDGGFDVPPEMATVAARSRAASPREPAMAYCLGTPLRGEVEARDRTKLAAATDASEQAIAARFGSGAVDGKIQAHIIGVVK